MTVDIDTLQIQIEAESTDAAARVNALTDSLERLQSVIKGGRFSSIVSKIRGVRDSASSANSSKTRQRQRILENAGQQTVDASVGQQMESATEKVGILNRALNNLKSIGSGAGNILEKMGSALSSLSSGDLTKFNSGLKSIGSVMASRFTKPIVSAVDVVAKWKNSFGRIAFYRAIRAAIASVTSAFKEGTSNLYQYSRLTNTEFAPAMDSLATSALYLKNSFAAMAAPLIQAVAPAVDYLVDKFVDLLNVIGKVFAALSGKSTYTQAVKVAKEYAETTNEAADAASNFLLSIDELNILDNSSGAGSGSAEDYGSMFEEVEVPTETMDWAAQIRQAIEDGDWRGAGSLLAEKLNGIMDSWDPHAWGVSLGKKINSGLNAAYGFMTTFDFESLGSKATSGLNGILDTADWDLLGRTFASKWNALIDMLYGFVTTFEWVKFGKAISDAVNGWFNEIDWVKAAQAISTGVKGALVSVSTALEETDFVEIGRSVGEFIINIDWVGILSGAANAIADALLGVFQAAFGLVAEGLTGSGDGILGNALSVAAGSAVAVVTVSYLTSLLKTIGTKLSKLSAAKKKLASAVLVAIEFSVSEWSIKDFLDTGDFKDILINLLSTGVSSYLLYRTLGAKGLIIGVAVGVVANITSLTTELASGLSWNDPKALFTEAITLVMGGAGGGIGLTKIGFTAGEGIVIGLSVTAALTFAAINFGGIASGAWDAGSAESILATLASTAAAGIGGYVLAGAVFGSAAGPVGLAIGLGVGLVLSIAAVSMGQKTAYENSDFYKEMEEWIAQAEESIEISKQIKVNIETRYSEYSEIENEYAAYIGILDEIFRLDEIPEKSASELALMSSYVDIINELNLDGLYLHFDDTNTKIVETKDSIYGVIDALTAQAKMEAIYDLLVEAYRDQATEAAAARQAADELATANALVAEKQAAYNEVVNDYLSAAEASGYSLHFLTSESGLYNEALSTARAELEDAKTVQGAWQTALDESNDTLATLSGRIDSFNDELIGLKSTSDEASEPIVNTFSGLSGKWEADASGAMTAFKGAILGGKQDLLNAVTETGGDISGGLLQGAEKEMVANKKSWKDWAIWPWNWFKEENEINSPSKKFSELGGYLVDGLLSGASDAWPKFAAFFSSETEAVKATLSNAWDSVKSTATTKFTEVKTAISSVWSSLVSSAKTWGSDICSSLANGIRGAIGTVTSAASSIASKISSYLHFSEPDIGPLSDFHTYMPDMLELMAKGIKDNTYLAVNAVSDLGSSVASAFSEIGTTELQFPVHEDAYVHYGVEFADRQPGMTGNSDDSESFAAGIRSANEEMINVIYAVAQQIVTAVNSNSGDIYLDGVKVGGRTTSIQNRQNRMYGKTLQNA